MFWKSGSEFENEIHHIIKKNREEQIDREGFVIGSTAGTAFTPDFSLIKRDGSHLFIEAKSKEKLFFSDLIPLINARKELVHKQQKITSDFVIVTPNNYPNTKIVSLANKKRIQIFGENDFEVYIKFYDKPMYISVHTEIKESTKMVRISSIHISDESDRKFELLDFDAGKEFGLPTDFKSSKYKIKKYIEDLFTSRGFKCVDQSDIYISEPE